MEITISADSWKFWALLYSVGLLICSVIFAFAIRNSRPVCDHRTVLGDFLVCSCLWPFTFPVWIFSTYIYSSIIEPFAIWLTSKPRAEDNPERKPAPAKKP